VQEEPGEAVRRGYGKEVQRYEEGKVGAGGLCIRVGLVRCWELGSEEGREWKWGQARGFE
jgi:hypothetical protein